MNDNQSIKENPIATVWDAEFECSHAILRDALREFLSRLRSGEIRPYAFGFIELSDAINFIDFQEEQYEDGAIYLLQSVICGGKAKKEVRNTLGVFIIYFGTGNSTHIVLRCVLETYAPQYDHTVEIAKHFANEAIGHGIKVKLFPKVTEFKRDFTVQTSIDDLIQFFKRFNYEHLAFGYWIDIPEDITRTAFILLKTNGHPPKVLASRSPYWRHEIGVIDCLQLGGKTRLQIYASNREEREHFWAYINIIKREMMKFDLIEALDQEAEHLLQPVLTSCLDEFAFFVKSKKRMTFWDFDRLQRKHKWIPSPEKHAKDLLETYLCGKFGQELHTFQEIISGAGKIDLFVITPSNEKAIIELKMCGVGYSEGYAQEGVDQLLHYMENYRVNQGFLIVFDSRIRDFSNGFQKIQDHKGLSIVTIVVDVRDRVKKLPNNRLKADGGDSAHELGLTHPEVGSDPENGRVPPAAS